MGRWSNGTNSIQAVEVTGTVSYRGSALSTGAVVFFPEKGRPLDPAKIGPDGVYRLEAPVGTYRVGVISMIVQPRGADDEQKPLEESGASVRSLIPQLPVQYDLRRNSLKLSS